MAPHIIQSPSLPLYSKCQEKILIKQLLLHGTSYHMNASLNMGTLTSNQRSIAIYLHFLPSLVSFISSPSVIKTILTITLYLEWLLSFALVELQKLEKYKKFYMLYILHCCLINSLLRKEISIGH